MHQREEGWERLTLRLDTPGPGAEQALAWGQAEAEALDCWPPSPDHPSWNRIWVCIRMGGTKDFEISTEMMR
jgi:hypothetical protein